MYLWLHNCKLIFELKILLYNWTFWELDLIQLMWSIIIDRWWSTCYLDFLWPLCRSGFFPCDIIRWRPSHIPPSSGELRLVSCEASRDCPRSQIHRFPAWAGWRAALKLLILNSESGEEFLHSPFLTDCVVGQNKHWYTDTLDTDPKK